MSFKNILDLHTHSDCSPDAKHSVSLMCEHALRKGIRAIAVTDHCECDAYIRDKYNITSSQSIFQAAKARTVFEGQMIVLLGIELGQPILDLKAAESALSRPSLDFVLTSMHNLRDREDFYYMDYSLPENDPYKLLDEYFDSILQIVEWGNFDSLAHLTYPLRYMVGKHRLNIDISRFYDKIDCIFKGLIEKGKSLEINTSGFRQELGTSMPDLPLIRRYRSLGGELVTIGSDAHCAQDVGRGIKEGMELASEAGFKFTTLYQRRIPTPIIMR